MPRTKEEHNPQLSLNFNKEGETFKSGLGLNGLNLQTESGLGLATRFGELRFRDRSLLKTVSPQKKPQVLSNPGLSTFLSSSPDSPS